MQVQRHSLEYLHTSSHYFYTKLLDSKGRNLIESTVYIIYVTNLARHHALAYVHIDLYTSGAQVKKKNIIADKKAYLLFMWLLEH